MASPSLNHLLSARWFRGGHSHWTRTSWTEQASSSGNSSVAPEMRIRNFYPDPAQLKKRADPAPPPTFIRNEKITIYNTVISTEAGNKVFEPGFFFFFSRGFEIFRAVFAKRNSSL